MLDFAADRIAVHVSPAAVRAVRRDHPWIYDQGIHKQNKQGATGDLAILFDKNRQFIGIGLYDAESPIRVRVLHSGRQTQIDRDWFDQRLTETFSRRTPLIEDPTTTGYRLVHGENDRLPGLVIDRYDTTLVIKLDTAAWLPHLDLLKELCCEQLQPERIVLRLSRSVQGSPALPSGVTDGSVIHGPALDGPVIFLENGLRFEAEPVKGQKTGFFLDQRDNRARVGELAMEKSVLNVFAYTGGFSLYAARGGAKSVVSLDISAPALAAADRNFALNHVIAAVAAAQHETLCADAFHAMKGLSESSRRFDVVILDPPSFARKQADVDKAVAAYERLARLGLRVLKRGGVLVAASCSARVPAEVFFQTIQRAGEQSKRPLNIMERTAHALDHPIGFPEGAYLKCLYARA